MRNKTLKKIIISIIMVLFVSLFYLCPSILANLDDPTSIVGNGPDGTTGVGTLATLGNAILGIIQYVGIGVSVIATLVLGMRYMYSSPDDKAEIKKKLIPFIIGGVLVFGAVRLVILVETFVGDIM